MTNVKIFDKVLDILEDNLECITYVDATSVRCIIFDSKFPEKEICFQISDNSKKGPLLTVLRSLGPVAPNCGNYWTVAEKIDEETFARLKYRLTHLEKELGKAGINELEEFLNEQCKKGS
jgi:hypothetical protein